MIRKAKKQDAYVIARLLSNLGFEIEEKTGAKINTDKELIMELFEKYLDKEFRAFVYEQDSKVIGFVTFYNSFSLYANGHFFTITELYVDRDHRSKSIGKELLFKVIDLAKEEGRSRIELTTPPLPQFQRSLEFYQKNGFEITGGRKVKIDLY